MSDGPQNLLPTFMSSSEQPSLSGASGVPTGQPQLFLSNADVIQKQHTTIEDILEINNRDKVVPHTATSTSFLFRQLRYVPGK